MRVMFLGAHPDDIESGAAGLIMRMSSKAEISLLVFSDCEEQPGNRGITKEFEESMKVLGIDKENFKLLDFPNTKFPQNQERIRDTLEKYGKEWKPDVIVTHSILNTHQDHKTLTEEALRVFRNKSIIMYEDLKSTPDFVPNLILSLTREQFEEKLGVLRCYKTQARRYYFDPDYITSLAKVRGKQMGVEFGEAFHIHRFILQNSIKGTGKEL